MRFDKMTRHQKRLLEKEYIELFGEQIMPIKELFANKSDSILLDDLLDNISITLYRVITENNLDKAESLLERMQLSGLEYDVLILNEIDFSEYEMSIYFYNIYQIVEFTNMRIRHFDDIKKIILMILHIGNQYDQLYESNHDVAKHLDEYRLLDGFDQSFILNIKTGNAEKEIVN